jgi:hypothetical protein
MCVCASLGGIWGGIRTGVHKCQKKPGKGVKRSLLEQVRRGGGRSDEVRKERRKGKKERSKRREG